MTAVNRRPDHRSEAPRILQIVPVVANSSSDVALSAASTEGFGIYAQLGSRIGNTTPAPLLIHLHGGQYVNKPQRALFAFHCDPLAEEPSEPVFSWSTNGTHAFTWKTKHACAHMHATPPEPSSDEPSPDADTPPPDEGKDLVTTPPLSDRTSKRSITTILLCTAAGVFFLGYLTLHPPQPIRRRIAPYLRTFRRSRFRSAISEYKVLHWAQEDLALMDEEEDEMVNAHEEGDLGALDEQIPLKPSPKHGLLANYGTARQT